MEYTGAIIIVLLAFAFFLVTGHYMSTLMYGVGMIGILLVGGMGLLQGFLINEPYRTAASYSLSTIPLYVLMAMFIMESGIIRDFYAMVFKFSRGKKWALGALTILLGGFLGAVSGSGIATSASLGKISVPELRSRGYSGPLAGAVAAAAGSLSSIIPPSIILIVYGTAAQQSVGKLFMASFIPGALVMVVYALTTIVLLNTKKERNHSEVVEKTPEVTLSTGRTIFVLIAGASMVISIFGGIYSGLFTPTEAGAVGAFIAFIVALVTKAVNREFMKHAMLEAVKVTGMSMIIIIAASLFGRFVTLSMLPRYIMSSLEPLIARPALLLAILCAIYFVMFMFLDGTATLLLTVPILLPIMTQMNIDLLWFGVFICMICTIGTLSPPVGFCVYAVAGVSDIPIQKIFRVAMIFAIAATAIVGTLMIVLPGTATWLPSTMV